MAPISADETTSWAPNPHYRGTLQLLFSSILTISLCIYSSLHLNVPPAERSRKRHVLEKLLWASVGIFATEFVVFMALIQTYTAWRLQQDLARIRRSLLDDMSSSPATEEAGRQSPPTKNMMTTTMEYNQHMEQNRAWGPIHCQFDTMGGFAVVWPHPTDDQPSQGEDGTPEGLMTLTPKGIRALAQIDQLPRITEAQIVDKSKKESIGKAIVCIRVVWAVAQVLSRLAAKLPVTLLELSTIGHIAHAIVMYTLWWYKPYNIMEPMTIPWDQGMMDFLK
ncbi:hypothetical protein PG988_006392 [Apiospora saccharicola]